jgi:hypothetical protein
MRGKAAVLIAGVVLGSAGTGVAATQLVYVKGVACLRSDQKGYAVTLTHTKVIVWRGTRRVFFRRQP